MDFYKETNKRLICENLSDKEFEVLQRIDKLFIVNDVSRCGKYIYIKYTSQFSIEENPKEKKITT